MDAKQLPWVRGQLPMMRHRAFSKVFDKVSCDIYVDGIGSGLVDNIVRWVALKWNYQKNTGFSISTDSKVIESGLPCFCPVQPF